MKITALKKFLVVLGVFLGFIFFIVFADWVSAATTSEGVGVAAEVILLGEQEAAIKGISGIIASPSPARVGYIIQIKVTLKGYDGMLLPFHSVRIEAEGPGSFEITQPVGLTSYDGFAEGKITSDVAGVYTVYAYDTTYEEKDIKINDSADAIFIAEGIPLLYSEPEYTQGYSNILDWEPLENIVQYYIEASDSEEFNNIVYNSGWISQTEYEFTGLLDGMEYYYRVKGRNEVGANTLWSNIVVSTQDALPPQSEVVDVEKLENGFKVYIESEDAIGEVKLVDIYVKMDDGTWILIKSTEIDSVTIDFTEIEGFDPDNKPERICFYSRAEDTVGNLELMDPGETGDYCVGYGLTLQNIIDLVSDQSEKLVLIVTNLFNSGVEKLTTLIENNLLLFIVLVFLPLLVYISLKMYDSYFSLGNLGNLFDLWNLKMFPWLVPDENKKSVGVVYDSFSHEPLKDVLVKLIYKDEIVQMDLTDDFGVFRFEPEKKKYTIVCWKAGYDFPSRIDNKEKDPIYDLVYKGDVVVIGSDSLIGVPIDFKERSDEYEVLYWTIDFFMDIFRFVNPVLLILGIIVSLLLNSILGTSLFYVLAILYGLFLIHLFGMVGQKRARWGIIRDGNKVKLGGIKIGLYNAKFDKLIDYRITGGDGRYRFVVPSGKYVLKLLSDGYEIEGKKDLRIDLEKGRVIEITQTLTIKKI